MSKKKNKEKAVSGGSVFARMLIGCGVLALLLSAAGFVFRTMYRNQSGERSAQILEKLTGQIPQEPDPAAALQDFAAGPEELSLIQVSGVVCAGLLSIPDLRQVWPVGGLYEELRMLPCLVKNEKVPELITIEGMDYESQFSILRQLTTGDEVIFTDVIGLTYRFKVDFTGTDPGRREKEWQLELLSYMGDEEPFCVGCLAV